MLTWKMQKTLPSPKNPEWDLLVKSCLGESVHPERISGFILSRMALQACLKEKGILTVIPELVIENYRETPSAPQFTISLSHTPEAGAALIAPREKFVSVGIDIEHEKRPVKDSIIERISHPEDEALRNIELWCLKEAAFKALMNTGRFQKPLEFSSIKIGNHFWSHAPTGLEAPWELENVNSMLVARTAIRS